MNALETLARRLVAPRLKIDPPAYSEALHAIADLPRLPVATHVEAMDDHACMFEAGSDNPHVPLMHMGTLEADFEVLAVPTWNLRYPRSDHIVGRGDRAQAEAEIDRSRRRDVGAASATAPNVR